MSRTRNKYKRLDGFQLLLLLLVICLTVTIGIALAGNLVTFLLFYEMLTLTTYPLIIHRGTQKALRAGRNYLIYAFSGGAVFLFAVVSLQAVVGPTDFTAAG